MKAIWLGVLLLACSDSATDAPVCEEKACESGFAIDVRSARPRILSIRISGDDKVIHTLTCNNAVQCVSFFKDQTPFRLTVEVTTATKTTAYTLYPQYNTLRPNGLECSPECKRADVTIIVI